MSTASTNTTATMTTTTTSPTTTITTTPTSATTTTTDITTTITTTATAATTFLGLRHNAGTRRSRRYRNNDIDTFTYEMFNFS